MPSRLVLLIFSLLIFTFLISPSLSKSPNLDNDDDDEDLSFLLAEDQNDGASQHTHHSDSHHLGDENDDEFDDPNDDDFNYDEFAPTGSEFGHEYEEDDGSKIEVDEKDVVVLKGANFSDFIKNNQFVMVEFYAPWCGHCQAMAPEYAAAATELKAEKVALAKVDATEENELAEKYEVQGFPTVYFFIDGVHKPYPGQRTKYIPISSSLSLSL